MWRRRSFTVMIIRGRSWRSSRSSLHGARDNDDAVVDGGEHKMLLQSDKRSHYDDDSPSLRHELSDDDGVSTVLCKRLAALTIHEDYYAEI